MAGNRGWQLTVNSVTPDGTQQVLAASPSNTPPPAGRQYLMISITVTYSGTGPISASGVPLGLSLVGASNVAYSIGSPRAVEPPRSRASSGRRSAMSPPGSSIAGNLCFSVASSAADSLLLQNEPVAGPPTWFALR